MKSSTLTKACLAQTLYEELNIHLPQAKGIVDDFFEEIRVHLEQGEEVKFSGLGVFGVREKKARPGRNPKTGEKVRVSERRVVTFKPMLSLKKSLKKS